MRNRYSLVYPWTVARIPRSRRVARPGIPLVARVAARGHRLAQSRPRLLVRVRLDDDQYGRDFVGFMQRARCIVVAQGGGVYEVFLAHDLSQRLARAELASYLLIWERGTPGGRAELLED